MLLGVFILATIGAQSALAVAEPEFTVESTSTGTIGKSKLNLTGASIKCEKGSDAATSLSKKLLRVLFEFSLCTLGGEECHVLGGLKGSITISAELHVVRLKTGVAGLWVLYATVHIACLFETTLVLLKGNVIGSLTPILSDTKGFTLNLTVVGGAQEFTQWENAAGEKVTAKLEGSINAGAFKAATTEAAEDAFTSELLTEVIKTT